MTMFRRIRLIGALVAPLAFTVSAYADVTVYAAASLTDAMNELDTLYEKKYRTTVKTSYAASSTLAKQIEAGAPADVYLSADLAWMTYLTNKNIISQTNRINLLGNRLVMISPSSNPIKTPIKMDKSFNIGKTFTGKLCTGHTQSVPVGKYAKQALTHLGWWQTLQPRLVETEDVRSALNFVARGECQLGIVYSTDAKSTSKVMTVATFPLASHPPIVYPAGLIKPNNADAKRFYQFLQSAEAKAVFEKHGFSVLR